MKLRALGSALALLSAVTTPIQSVQDQPKPKSLQERIRADWLSVRAEGEEAFQEKVNDQINSHKKYFDEDRWPGTPGYQPPVLIELENGDGDRYIMEIVDPSEEENYSSSETFTYAFEFKGEKGAVMIGSRYEKRSYDQLEDRLDTVKKELEDKYEGMERATWAFGLGEAKKYGADGFSAKAIKIMEHAEVNPFGRDYFISSYAVPEITFYFKGEKTQANIFKTATSRNR